MYKVRAYFWKIGLPEDTRRDNALIKLEHCAQVYNLLLDLHNTRNKKHVEK